MQSAIYCADSLKPPGTSVRGNFTVPHNLKILNFGLTEPQLVKQTLVATAAKWRFVRTAVIWLACRYSTPDRKRRMTGLSPK